MTHEQRKATEAGRASPAWISRLMATVSHRLAEQQLATVAANCRALRTAHGLSTTALARRAGVGQKTVWNLENRVGTPTLANLVAIAGGLRVQPFVLFFPDANTPEAAARLGDLLGTYTSTDARGRDAIDRVADTQRRYTT